MKMDNFINIIISNNNIMTIMTTFHSNIIIRTIMSAFHSNMNKNNKYIKN